MSYHILLVLLVIILFYEMLKLNFKICAENFTSDKKYILSNHKYIKYGDIIAEDEEINVGSDKKMKYKFILAPILTNIGIYIKGLNEKTELEETISTSFYTVKDYKVINITNIIPNISSLKKKNYSELKYFIKFLSKDRYDAEINVQTDSKIITQQFNNCIKSNRNIMQAYKAIDICKKEFPTLSN